MPQHKVTQISLKNLFLFIFAGLPGNHTTNNMMSSSFLLLQLIPVSTQTSSGHVNKIMLFQNSVQVSAPLNWIKETHQT